MSGKKILIAMTFVVAITATAAFSVVAVASAGKYKKNETKPLGAGWEKPHEVTIRGFNGNAQEPYITRDNKYLLFNDWNMKDGTKRIHYAVRVNDRLFEHKGEVVGANLGRVNTAPSMDADGNLYFVSDVEYSKTFSSLYVGKFVDGQLKNVRPVSGDFNRKEIPYVNFDVEISPSGTYLYTVDSRINFELGWPETADLVVAKLSEDGLRYDKIDGIFKNINLDSSLEYAPSISRDGLEIYFTRFTRLVNPLTGSNFSMYVSRRSSVDSAFEKPERIDAIGAGLFEGPSLSNSGDLLYFHKLDNGRFKIFVLERE